MQFQGMLLVCAAFLVASTAASYIQGVENVVHNLTSAIDPIQKVDPFQCGPIAPGQGFLPGGNIRTVDYAGPYNLSLLSVQADEIQAGIAAKQSYTDKDIIDFLTNVECLEGLFDTWGTFGTTFNNNLTLGGPTPIGARKAALSPQAYAYMEEVALNEQGHALFTRQAGSMEPCPLLDFTGGFNKFLAAAYGLASGETISSRFGKPFDPFLNDETFVTCVATLEELGATGNKGLIGFMANPVLANGLAGLATSATAQATVERILLWERRNNTVEPFGETVQQVYARISALRDRLDGPVMDDQGLVNTDPRFIATSTHINNVPTDVRGLTFSRTPQQIINILTLGSPDGVGCFFPKGFLGKINKPTGYDASASGTIAWDASGPPKLAVQQAAEFVPNVGPTLPENVTGELDLTQCLNGPLENATAASRGLVYEPACKNFFSNASQVAVGVPVTAMVVPPILSPPAASALGR